MSYHYSSQDIEDMYNAGILQRPNNHSCTSSQKSIIERNTKCPKCGGPVKVVKWNDPEGIVCQQCDYKFT